MAWCSPPRPALRRGFCMPWTRPAGRNCGTAAKQSPLRSMAAGFRPEIVRFIFPPTTEHSMRLVFRLSINATYFVARTLVSAASRIVSTLFQDCSEVGNFSNVQDGHRDESRCGSLKSAPRFDLRRVWAKYVAFGGRLAFVLTIFAAVAWAQLADGPGRAETVKLCSHCHELERS